MKMKISQETFNEIKSLVEDALGAPNKKEAERYISRLDFMRRTGGYGGYANVVFAQFVASVKSASGRVSDKERLCGFAMQELYKLEGQIGKEEN